MRQFFRSVVLVGLLVCSGCSVFGHSTTGANQPTTPQIQLAQAEESYYVILQELDVAAKNKLISHSTAQQIMALLPKVDAAFNLAHATINDPTNAQSQVTAAVGLLQQLQGLRAIIPPIPSTQPST